MKRLMVLWHVFFITCLLKAQSEKYTISGFISDKSTGEKLINANIYDPVKFTGTVSNLYGFYSLTLPKGKHSITYSFVGYRSQTIDVDINENQLVNIQLQNKTIDEVTVIGSEVNDKLLDVQMSKEIIPINMIKSIPSLMGEVDVMKSLQLLPGVQSGTEGTSGLYVRGGGNDQNLILLDGVSVYNANHLFGFFSVFNPNAIKSVSLYKGGFPARFGGRLSSVVDVRMKEGNEKEIHGGIQVGLISSNLFVEGPVKKDKTAFHFSARRTYIDALTRPFMKNMQDQVYYNFYDLNAKINHKFSDKDRLYVSAYLGRDNANINTQYENEAYSTDNYYSPETRTTDKNKLFWGNSTISGRWNHIFNPKLFSNTTLIYSKYLFNVSERYKDWEDSDLISDLYYRYKSGIQDVGSKLEFDWYPILQHQIKFGGQFIHHVFEPGVETYNGEDKDDYEVNKVYGNPETLANEMNLFVEDNWMLTSRLRANIGLHFSAFNVENTLYSSFEPRTSLRLIVSDKLSFKGSYAKMQQYLHLLSNSTIGLPTDLWLPSTKRIKPQISNQYALGGVYNFNKKYSFSSEVFYKEMDNLIEYKEGASFFGSSLGWEDKVEEGKGTAYGLELMARKDIGKTSGWIGYTWSKTNRQFDNLNIGKSFPARYDRRHDVSIVLTHMLNDKIDFGLTWVYCTGNAVTLPTHNVSINPGTSTYYLYDEFLPYQESRNNYRMPSYHRLDFGVNFHKKKEHGIRIWNISIYNLYNHFNPFYIYVEEPGYNVNQVLKQVSLFPILPSVSYKFEF